MSSLSALSLRPLIRTDRLHFGRARRRKTAAVLASALIIVAAPAAADAAESEQGRRAITSAATAQQAADLGSANAATHDVAQSTAVIDRATGELVGGFDGDRVFETESILKMFTAAFYLLRSDGAPDAELAAQLRTMIELSDNGIQSSLWRADVVPSIADRYGLTNTRKGPRASARNWGSDRTTANDQARFLYRMSQDPLVAPHLMSWMASAAPAGSDEFNQAFGFNALSGDHGSKQGWTDPGRSPVNLHSVGWTERYFAAILQNSGTATYATMRETSTHTAQLIAAAGQPAPSNPAPLPSDAPPPVLAPAAPSPAPVPPDPAPAASSPPPGAAGPQPETSNPVAAAPPGDSPNPADSDVPSVTSVAPTVISGGQGPTGASTEGGSAILSGLAAAVSAPDGPAQTARSLAHTIASSDPVQSIAIGKLAAHMLFDDLRC